MSDNAWNRWDPKDSRGTLKLFGPDQFDQHLIRDFGVPLLEGVVLEPLVESERYEFFFVGSAAPIVGATGSPHFPVAGL